MPGGVRLAVRELTTGREVIPAGGMGPGFIFGARFSPDSRRIGVIDGAWSGPWKLTVLDLETGHGHQLGLMAEFHGMLGSGYTQLASIDFTRNGDRVLAVGGDQQLRMWDLSSGREILPEGWPGA
jgi:hypothetical protein